MTSSMILTSAKTTSKKVVFNIYGAVNSYFRSRHLSSNALHASLSQSSVSALNTHAINPFFSAIANINTNASPRGRAHVLARSSMKPHPQKIAGEDACFIAPSNAHNILVTGVADGVGGWSEAGIDSGVYARELMQRALQASNDPELRSNPKNVLQSAHDNMSRSTKGSCTACIVVFDGNELRYANLGDSGLLGYRRHEKEPFVRSKEQVHSFNCPFQLGHNTGDTPSKAVEGSVQIQTGDVIVLGTDGFFDNLYNARIIQLIDQFVNRKDMKDHWPKGKNLDPITNKPIIPQQIHARGIHTSATDLAASLAATSLSPSSSTSSIPSAPSSPASTARSRSASPTRKGEGSSASFSTSTASSASFSASTAANSSSATSTTAPSVSMATDFRALTADELQRLADLLVFEARRVAEDHRADTPFSQEARRHGKRFKGGKLDDITVVVCQVIMDTSSGSDATANQATANPESSA